MCDVSAAVGQQVQIATAELVQPRVLVDEDCVAEQGFRPEQDDIGRPLDRRLAMPAHHLVELEHALRCVRGQGQTTFSRNRLAVAQKPLRAGVDLSRGEQPVESAPGVARPTSSACRGTWTEQAPRLPMAASHQQVRRSSRTTRFVRLRNPLTEIDIEGSLRDT